MVSKRYTAVENWLWENLKLEESDSAHQSYENMLLQGGGALPLINVTLNLREQSHFADETIVQQIAALLRGTREVLDIGSGDGWPSLRLAPWIEMITSIDAAPRRIEVSRANAERLKIANVKFLPMSAVELNFSDNRFDAAVAASSIEQTPDPMRALREIYRVLKPGARLVVIYESFDVTLEHPFEDAVTVREHMDGTHGWYYWMKHRDPPWERDYLVRFKATPETDEAFARARELIDRDGANPTAVPGIGAEFLEANKAAVAASSFYELEHFTAKTMKETLEDVGFTDVRVFYSASKLARLLFPNLNAGEMGEHQLMELAQGLAQTASALPAPFDQGQPIIAQKPETTS